MLRPLQRGFGPRWDCLICFIDIAFVFEVSVGRQPLRSHPDRNFMVWWLFRLPPNEQRRFPHASFLCRRCRCAVAHLNASQWTWCDVRWRMPEQLHCCMPCIGLHKIGMGSRCCVYTNLTHPRNSCTAICCVFSGASALVGCWDWGRRAWHVRVGWGKQVVCTAAAQCMDGPIKAILPLVYHSIFSSDR